MTYLQQSYLCLFIFAFSMGKQCNKPFPCPDTFKLFKLGTNIKWWLITLLLAAFKKVHTSTI